MTPNELKKMLAPYGIRPIRDRGQHFLLDDRTVAAMVRAAGVGEGDAVVEIGPGPGILTSALLAAGAGVIAVELDMKLCALLRYRFPQKNFHLLQGDALRISNAHLVKEASSFVPKGGTLLYKVVANIPYNITSQILEKFLFEEPKPESLTVMIQKEVAERILAKPGGMSALAVMVQTLGEPRLAAKVPRSSFFPPPKVDSAVIHIAVKDPAAQADFFHGLTAERYFAVVRSAFSERRKQLKNTLRRFCPDMPTLEKCFIKAKVEPSARPETLSPDDWRRLAETLPP